MMILMGVPIKGWMVNVLLKSVTLVIIYLVVPVNQIILLMMYRSQVLFIKNASGDFSGTEWWDDEKTGLGPPVCPPEQKQWIDLDWVKNGDSRSKIFQRGETINM